jgi:membrane protease YdiL (CAAX protease family)
MSGDRSTLSAIFFGKREIGAGLTGGIAIGLPVVGITASELLLYFEHTNLALTGHALTLALCTLAPLWLASEMPVFRAFALVPLFRLVNLGMPVFFDLTLVWFPFVYGPLIPALILIGRDQESIKLMRVPRPLYLVGGLPLVVALSLVLAEVEYSIIQPEALVPSLAWSNLLLIGVVMIFILGFVEELLFRGILQQSLEERIGTVPGILLASMLFGLMHSGYGVPAEMAFASVIGLVLGVVYDRTESILLVTVIHGLLNVFLFAIIPIRGSILGLPL